MVASWRDRSSTPSDSRRRSPILPDDLAGARLQRVEVAVLLQPLGGRLRSDAWHARNVVRGVADQRQVVDDLLGRHVELLLHASAVERRVAHRVDERDVLVDELRHVLVAGRDHRLLAGGRRLACERADHVVGLDALDAQQRHAQRLDGFEQRRDLRAQVVRHRRAVRLVLGEQVVAEGLARRVEHHGHALGRASSSSLCSMFSTPSTAPVGSPLAVESGGSAWNARYR